MEQFTQPDNLVHTDKYDSYNALKRARETVCLGVKELGRDEDADGWCEVHTNSTEGLWTGLRNFLRPFRGVSKHFLHGYVAIHEFRVDLKSISPDFISPLGRRHSF